MTERPNFRDIFEVIIHNNQQIAFVKKLMYLKGAVAGDAAQVIEFIPAVAANYNFAGSRLSVLKTIRY